MTNNTLYSSAYAGTKDFSQQDLVTVNATGFGAATDDYAERGIDLNEQLIMNKPATFFFRMNSDAMLDAGVHQGDVLIVDRSIKAVSGKMIIAAIDGELMVRNFLRTTNTCWLEPANKRFGNIPIGEFTTFEPWGVVTCVIHLIDPALVSFNAPKKPKVKK